MSRPAWTPRPGAVQFDQHQAMPWAEPETTFLAAVGRLRPERGAMGTAATGAATGAAAGFAVSAALAGLTEGVVLFQRPWPGRPRR